MKHSGICEFVNKELKLFEELLKQWLCLNERYYRDCDEITSCYTEMSCVSLLNAAAWSCASENWLGLQEYQSEKLSWDNKKSETKNGRIDLHLYNKEKKIGYGIEAKRVFIDLFKVKSEHIIKQLDEKSWVAWDAAEELKQEDDIDTILAMTFYDFQAECKKSEIKKVTDAIQKCVNTIRTAPFHAGAYWFPDKPIFQGGWAYCGTFLMIEEY